MEQWNIKTACGVSYSLIAGESNLKDSSVTCASRLDSCSRRLPALARWRVFSPRFQRRKKKPDASPTLLKPLVVRIFRRTFQRRDLAKSRF